MGTEAEAETGVSCGGLPSLDFSRITGINYINKTGFLILFELIINSIEFYWGVGETEKIGPINKIVVKIRLRTGL